MHKATQNHRYKLIFNIYLCTFLTLSGEIKYSQMIMILINIR